MALDPAAALAAIGRDVGAPLGLEPAAAAEGVVRVAVANMSRAIRAVSTERGFDLGAFALVAYGGAGPLHANALGRLMNSWPVIIPPGPGVLCAYGDASTRMRDEASRTYIRQFHETTAKEVARIFARLGKQASKALDKEGIPKRDQTTTYQVDIRYHGHDRI